MIQNRDEGFVPEIVDVLNVIFCAVAARAWRYALIGAFVLQDVVQSAQHVWRGPPRHGTYEFAHRQCGSRLRAASVLLCTVRCRGRPSGDSRLATLTKMLKDLFTDRDGHSISFIKRLFFSMKCSVPRVKKCNTTTSVNGGDHIAVTLSARSEASPPEGDAQDYGTEAVKEMLLSTLVVPEEGCRPMCVSIFVFENVMFQTILIILVSDAQVRRHKNQPFGCDGASHQAPRRSQGRNGDRPWCEQSRLPCHLRRKGVRPARAATSATRSSEVVPRGSFATRCAAQLGVGPAVHTAWYARHATRDWHSGLYVISDHYPYDLETVLCDDSKHHDTIMEQRGALTRSLIQCLHRLSEENIFVYDVKPSNVVLRFDEDDADQMDTRIIDFGRDFCEWSGCNADPESNTPVVDMLRKKIARDETADAVVSHVLFATMMVILSSTITHAVYHDRTKHRLDKSARARIHPLAEATSQLLDSMRGENLALLYDVLRMDDVRGVLRHYHGRRNSGTKRTIAMARGVEL